MKYNKKILIVEDDELNRTLLAEIIKREGLEPETAKNGLEAVELYKNNKQDVIFMDLNMPVMSGYEAAAAIKNMALKSNRVVIIAALTGDQRIESVDAEKNFDFKLTKPFLPSLINEIISNADKFEGVGTPIGKLALEADNDITKVLEKFGNDSVFLKYALEKFRVASHGKINELKVFLHSDLRELREILFLTHKLKGDFTIFNGFEAIKAIELLEKSISNNHSNDIDEICQYLVDQVDLIVIKYSQYV